MSLFVLSAALYGVAIVQCMSFAIFLTLQGNSSTIYDNYRSLYLHLPYDDMHAAS